MDQELKLKVLEVAVEMVQHIDAKGTKDVLLEVENNYKKIVELIEDKNN